MVGRGLIGGCHMVGNVPALYGSPSDQKAQGLCVSESYLFDHGRNVVQSYCFLDHFAILR